MTFLRRTSLFISIVCLAVMLAGCSLNSFLELADEQQAAPAVPADGEAAIHFIDVGQGDATLLQGPDFTILIDAGRHDRQDVVPYLQQAGVISLDLLVGTHPHADHIGQMDKVLEAFPVSEVWMSGDMHTSKTFERTLDAIVASGASYYEPRRGETFTIGSAAIDVLNPKELTGDFHEGSLSMKVTYGSVSFMFTGDAERQTEKEMISSGKDLSADIMQAGHHGSSTSNTRAFLELVQPELVIYSAGKENSYGHPHREVMKRLEEMKIDIYGTDEHGTIIVRTDGRTYIVEVER